MKSLRLVTLNTWKCEGDYATRLKVMAAELSQIKPDIVALQESFQTWDGIWDTADYLADHLDMKKILAPGRLKQRRFNGDSVTSYSSLALLTGPEINKHWDMALSAHPDDSDRRALFAWCAMADMDFILVNLHLTHLTRLNSNGDEVRAKQLFEVVEHAKQFNKNVILCGDFNCNLAQLNRIGAMFPDGELLDTWDLAGGVQPKPHTLRKKNQTGIHMERPPIDGVAAQKRAIDHILYLPLTKQDLLFSHPQRVFEGLSPEYGVVASDHMGLAITVSKRTNP